MYIIADTLSGKTLINDKHGTGVDKRLPSPTGVCQLVKMNAFTIRLNSISQLSLIIASVSRCLHIRYCPLAVHPNVCTIIGIGVINIERGVEKSHINGTVGLLPSAFIFIHCNPFYVIHECYITAILVFSVLGDATFVRECNSHNYNIDLTNTC